MFPRYMLIAGLTVLALGLFMGDLNAKGESVDFEQILPMVLAGDIIPSGLLGLLIAGLLAAFMSTFAATVNAAPAYLVNDIYKRYINADAAPKTYVYLSYVISVLFVLLGVMIGFFIPTLNQVIQWLVSALYGGYTASNVLKWYWWRFNGYGYFWGMITGFGIAFPLIFTDVSPINAFPFMFVACIIACVAGSLLTEADDMAVLKRFYLKVRPWGFWGPVLVEVQKDYPQVGANKSFKVDMLNVAVGVVWQTSIVAAPIFMVIKHWPEFLTAMTIAVITSVFLWFNWYKKLEDYPADTPAEVLRGTSDEQLIAKS
jgi:solute:Na+ symporter, SSS family